MGHFYFLLLVAAVALAPKGDEQGVPLAPYLPDDIVALFERLGPLRGAAIALGGFALIVGFHAWRVRLAGRRLDRTGRTIWVKRADHASLAAKWGVVLWNGVSVGLLGWVGVVRTFVGDPVVIDEVAALLPAVAAIVGVWASSFVIERRLREARIIGQIDRGEPVHSPPTRAQYVLGQFRLMAAPTLIASLLLVGWAEAIELIRARLESGGAWSAERLDLAAGAALLAGSVAVVALLPALWRVIWPTVRLPDGELRTALLRMTKLHGVRVSDLLIWQTGGAIVNGALVGLVPRLRYILLTDALLERLREQEVRAVMAHEVAHAKHRHIPWLIGAILVSVGLSAAAAGLVLGRVPGLERGGIELGVIAAAVVSSVLVLGYVSRRFEEQADAFAAQSLALERTAIENPALVRIGEADAGGMIDALSAVALHNHMPASKFSYRHGSIVSRQERLTRLVQLGVRALPIDRRVARLKGAILIGGALLALLLVFVPEARVLV